jgi:hypothetical protein
VSKKNEVYADRGWPNMAIHELKDSMQIGAVRRVFRRGRSERGKTAASCRRWLVRGRRHRILLR